MYQFARTVIFSAVSLVALSASFADAQFKSKVINGSDAAPNAWPFMVALVDASAPSAADGQFCGGTLIGPRHVLTAAHCVTDDYGWVIDPRSLVVQIGGDNLTFAPLNGREVLGISVHPDYNKYYIYNDLAVLVLKDPVATAPVELALTSDAALYAGGTSATVLGYGMTDPKLPLLPFTLQEATIPVASDQTCMNEIGRYFNPASQLCAGVRSSSATAYDGIDACYGDSGGPLVVSNGTGGYKQIGVVSWGLGCANGKTRGVYARIMGRDSFVTSFPEARPFALGDPTIPEAANATVGSTLTCTPPAYYGDAPTQITYQWYRGQAAIAGATAATYTAVPDDWYSSLSCSVEASNSAGSSGVVFSRPLGLLGAPPTVANSVQDTSAPTGSIRVLNCSSRTCSVIAFASDSTSSIASVQLQAEFSYQPKKGFGSKGSKKKAVKVRRTVTATTSFNSIWHARIRLVRKTKQNVKVTLRVTDSAGNTNTEADVRARTVVAD